jgi:hypothetical protein
MKKIRFAGEVNSHKIGCSKLRQGMIKFSRHLLVSTKGTVHRRSSFIRWSRCNFLREHQRHLQLPTFCSISRHQTYFKLPGQYRTTTFPRSVNTIMLVKFLYSHVLQLKRWFKRSLRNFLIALAKFYTFSLSVIIINKQ